MGIRSTLYRFARILGDLNAVKKGKVEKRIARRAIGKQAGKSIRWIMKD
jgi:hypothetical protein|tara:strand:+ start:1178 stop:1324 length:147 start_codon:yes stop_codon:yes gene_type:complete